jgi:hypothetical protein
MTACSLVVGNVYQYPSRTFQKHVVSQACLAPRDVYTTQFQHETALWPGQELV